MLGGASWSKCRDLAYGADPLPLKNCKDLIMKLKVKYLFPTSMPGTDFYIYQLPEGVKMREISVHDIRMQKNPQTRVDIFWILKMFVELCGSKAQLAPLLENFINGVTNPEIVS